MKLPGLLALGDQSLDEAAWQEARRLRVSATQATAIVGSSPYLNVMDVWNSKLDPNWKNVLPPIALRRANFGSQREAEIVKWASADPRTGAGDFIPNSTFYVREDDPRFGATPDAYKMIDDGDRMVLLECKTTSQDWSTDGAPQHVYDQVQWQLFVTGAVACYVAKERVVWDGMDPTVVDTYLEYIERDDRRLEFMRGRVDWFLDLLEQGISPESDVDLLDDDFDLEPEERAERQQIEAWLSEVAEIDDRTRADASRRADLVKLVKAKIGQYEGRRIHMIGSRSTAKLTRSFRAVVHTELLGQDVLRPLTEWKETERLQIDVRPSTPTKGTAE